MNIIDGTLISITDADISENGHFTVPKGVQHIGDSAFREKIRLKSITLPPELKSIAEEAFSGCKSLESVSIPEGVTQIGSAAFENCISLTSINIPQGMKYLSSWAFHNCSNLTSITIPKGVTSIGGSTFKDCSSATIITLPEGLEVISDDSIEGCAKLKAFVIDTDNDVEFARIIKVLGTPYETNLSYFKVLGTPLSYKAIMSSDFVKIQTIQQECLDNLCSKPTINPLSYLDRQGALFFSDSNDLLRYTNRFITDGSIFYAEAKERIMACPFPIKNNKVDFDEYKKSLLEIVKAVTEQSSQKKPGF